MLVDDIRASESNGVVTRSARVSWQGGELTLWIQAPAGLAAPADEASPYLPATLLLAMRRRHSLYGGGKGKSPLFLAGSRGIR